MHSLCGHQMHITCRVVIESPAYSYTIIIGNSILLYSILTHSAIYSNANWISTRQLLYSESFTSWPNIFHTQNLFGCECAKKHSLALCRMKTQKKTEYERQRGIGKPMRTITRFEFTQNPCWIIYKKILHIQKKIVPPPQEIRVVIFIIRIYIILLLHHYTLCAPSQRSRTKEISAYG